MISQAHAHFYNNDAANLWEMLNAPISKQGRDNNDTIVSSEAKLLSFDVLTEV